MNFQMKHKIFWQISIIRHPASIFQIALQITQVNDLITVISDEAW
jgi:hypothetical protein